jgi:hypothetical protein
MHRRRNRARWSGHAAERPAERDSRRLDARLHGHFSETHQTRIGRYLAERAHTFVSGNNRGHDFGVRLVGEPGAEFRVGGG